MSLQHKGIEITLLPNGEFKAKVNGVDITAGSFVNIKKKIDKTAPFEPFEAFSLNDYYVEDVKIHQVIGMVKIRGRNEYEFKTKDGRTYRWLHRGKDAMKRAKEYVALVKEHKKIRDQQEKLEEKMKAAIGGRISPDDLLIKEKENSDGKSAD